MSEVLTPQAEAMKGNLSYLATPYTKYPDGPEQAFRDAASLAARLLRIGLKVYSPIAHTHPIAVYGNIDPLDLSIWLPFDEAMMIAADVLIVAHMAGWKESRGIAHEIQFFEESHKPIFDLEPKTLLMVRRRMVRPVRDRVDGVTTEDVDKDRREFLGHKPLAHDKTPSEQGGASA